MLRCLGALFVALILAIGLFGWGYSTIDVDRAGGVSVKPSFNVSVGSIVSAIGGLFSGNLLGVVGAVLEGVVVEGDIEFSNGSFLPLYLPAMDHKVSIYGTQMQESFRTEPFVLMPGETHAEEFRVLVGTDQLPQLALEAVFGGGDWDIEVESSIGFGDFSFAKRTEFSGNVIESIQSRAAPTPTPRLTATARVVRAPTATATPRITPTAMPTATPTPRVDPTPTPKPNPTPTPTRTPTPTPSPTPTLVFLPTPTPTVTPTPTPVPGEPVTSVIVVPTNLLVLDDHDPGFAGRGEVYVVTAASDADGPVSWQGSAITMSLGDGEQASLGGLSVIVERPLANIRVYLGIWEQDNATCYPSVSAPWANDPQLTFESLVATVGQLVNCGDDLVGEVTFQLSADVDNWSSGFGLVTDSSVDATGSVVEVAISQTDHERQTGDAIISFGVQVVVTTLVATP